MRVFLAGVMQGMRLDDQVDDQSYRARLADALTMCISDVHIIDPWALNPDSVNYDAQRARSTFLSMTKEAGKVDVLIAYLPTVSMGTAMEMWEAFQNGTYIIAVTPHVHHWAIRFTADEILPSLDVMLAEIENGRFLQKVRAYRQIDAPLAAD